MAMFVIINCLVKIPIWPIFDDQDKFYVFLKVF
jgi:hypothetical protein